MLANVSPTRRISLQHSFHHLRKDAVSSNSRLERWREQTRPLLPQALGPLWDVPSTLTVSACCRPATIAHMPTRSTATIHVLRETAVNRADGGKTIKRGTNFKQAERKKYHEWATITQTQAVNMRRVRQWCLKFSHVEERQNKLHSLFLVC